MSSTNQRFSLREEKDFFHRAKKNPGKFGTLYVLLGDVIGGFVAVVPKTSLLTSVKRNFIKRRVRSILSSLSLKKGVFVYVARNAAFKTTFLALKEEIMFLTASYEQKH